MGADFPDSIASRADGIDPEHEELLADSVGPALLVVLETLTPAERLTFVLHDMFAVPFDEIALIVGRSPTAVRQLASRARRRVRGPAPVPEADRARQREVVDAFLAASRDGNFAALLALLDPDVVLRADSAAVLAGAPGEVRGAEAVAETFKGRARVAQPALVNGAVGAVWAPGGRPARPGDPRPLTKLRYSRRCGSSPRRHGEPRRQHGENKKICGSPWYPPCYSVSPW